MNRTHAKNAPPEPPADRDHSRLGLPELERAIRARDPAALLVLPRILRRVILQHRELMIWGLKVPHRKSYCIARGRLLEIVEKEELGVNLDEELPVKVILLESPSPGLLEELPAGQVLVHYWRLLFHARVHVAIEERAEAGELGPAAMRRRICQLGPSAFEEARTVLQQEGYLLPPHDDAAVYEEFAAVYLELRHFAPSMLDRYFPALDDPEAAAVVFAQDVDAPRLLAATRPAGAPDPQDQPEPEGLQDRPDADEIENDEEAEEPSGARTVSDRKFERLMDRADRAAAVGNVVRAAILRVKAERVATRKRAGQARAAVRADLNRLVQRLKAAMDLDPEGPFPWKDALAALIRQAPRGVWTVEARLLHDLQKVCVDHEREIHTIDLVEWVLSLGRRAIKRPLPSQRDLLMAKHLRSAARRLTAVRLSDEHRRHLAALLHAGLDAAETRIRSRFRPPIARVLDEVGLAPRNLPERVARDKLVEELLDRIVQRGFLTMGDVRDAISRSNLKLPDCDRPADLLRGDQVLRADHQLKTELDGVYRGGEFYLRWMQRLSSLAFGTRTGRFLVRYAAIPFGGAFVTLAFLDHMGSGYVRPAWYASFVAQVEVDRRIGEGTGWHGPGFASFLLHAALGLFLLLLLNAAPFRRGVWQAMHAGYRAVHAVLVDLPLRALRHPWLRQIVQSRQFKFIVQFVLKPLLFTLIAWWILPLEGTGRGMSLGAGAALFLAISLLTNSWVGREVEEILVDWSVLAWRRFGLRVISTFVWIVSDVFKSVLGAIERLLYAVDEWLRFKSGQSRITLAAKAGLGAIWFLVTYVVRFAVNLLIEPQINPIKHFPVVTVSHKLLLPLIPHLKSVLALTMDHALAWTVATAIITSIPGIFGFLVWELKENWRLYAANRRRKLAPVAIGDHGETMGRLLRRGFHSGTLPKRYAKLRRAERKARLKGNWKTVRKHLHVLHHVEESIRHYVEREFVALLAAAGSWQGGPISVARVRLGPSVVRIALRRDESQDGDLEIAFEARSAWLVAGVARPGWAAALAPGDRRALTAALLGLYASAGVDLVRQQLDAQLPEGCHYDVHPRGIVVWPDAALEREVLYPFNGEPAIQPQGAGAAASGPLPSLDRSKLLFSEFEIPWSRWVDLWDRGLPDDASSRGLLGPIRVLPTMTIPTDRP